MDYVWYAGIAGLILIVCAFLWAVCETWLEMHRPQREPPDAGKNVGGIDYDRSVKS